LTGPAETAILPAALEAGFVYHHALDDTIVLCQWLDQHIPNKIPPYATHQVGCAGVVTRTRQNKMQVLLIREPTSYEKWKLPGGVADKGEEFGDASVREVFEETGVQATFNHVMVMRNSHGLAFGKSDLYVVNHLIADADACVEIDTNEIDEAKWFDVEEWKTFTTHPINREVIAQLEERDGHGKIEEVKAHMGEDRPMFRLYVPRDRPMRAPNNTTGFVGVYKVGKRFVAKISIDGKIKHLGTYDTPKEAALAYDRAVVQHKLPSSKLNYPDGLPIDDEDYDEIMNPKKKRRLQSRNTTGYTGVRKSGKRFRAEIRIDGKQKYLGTYDTPKEAALAFDHAIIQHKLPSSRLNFPNDYTTSSEDDESSEEESDDSSSSSSDS
jgi:ADP-ribose pyrophosphatase YjhB (NUDIX family)